MGNFSNDYYDCPLVQGLAKKQSKSSVQVILRWGVQQERIVIRRKNAITQCVNAPAKIVCSITCDDETEADLRGPPRGVNRGFLLFTSTYLASKVRANLIGSFVQADGLVQP